MKLGAGVAGAAFILSSLVGLISGAGFMPILLRALFFALLFFGLSFGAQTLLSLFLPELFNPVDAAEAEAEADSGLGSRVDVVVGDEPDQPPASANADAERPRNRRSVGLDEGDDGEGIEAFLPDDGIAETAKAASDEVGLDQGREGLYTENKATDGVSHVFGGKGAEPALPSGLMDDVDVLPDLETMSDSFVSPLVEEATERSSAESLSPRSSSGSRSSEAGGDFDPREMAAAIQTILKRDQKG